MSSIERNRFDKTSKAASKVPENVIGSETIKKTFYLKKNIVLAFFQYSRR